MPSRLSAGGTITEVTRDLLVSKWPLAHWMPRAAERSNIELQIRRFIFSFPKLLEHLFN